MQSPRIEISEEVRDALAEDRPVVALETAVVTHGLPHPRNLEAAHSTVSVLRSRAVVPALCLLHQGKLRIGASLHIVEEIAQDTAREKASVRDLGAMLDAGTSGGLTVSATLFAAHLAGIRVFATGGIGGVHAGASQTGDISADLFQLARSPVITVCSGAKSVLDIPRTLEFLETSGVPVFSYGSSAFPAFYLTDSGETTSRVDSPEQIARISQAQWDVGYQRAVVIANPIPVKEAIPPDEWQVWLDAAYMEAAHAAVRGKAVTPFLLDHIAQLSGGRSVRANLALLISNADLAGQIAIALAP